MSEQYVTKKEVLSQAKELGKLIAGTEEVDFFKRAEKQINQNLKVQELIGKIKKKQKEAVNLQHYQKGEALKNVEKEIDELNAQLDEIPIVNEFKSSQTEVNELLQLVSGTISNKVTDEIITSMGGDVLQGTTNKNPFLNINNK
ncbi:RicAFT regulatory complex protein RicA family protein [Thalassorhabdus alkalitolerans]|uniref:RicAFT regulatory complex protein RicA family protein n=1 Tax=Thalassorhabdus alkalitolerans TaxID=2282697 RepID=A0ABW0YKZ5_9BACI|nr:RicAFT regulatory complex protein RicA family protein [Thalassobacillus sp. C254]